MAFNLEDLMKVVLAVCAGGLIGVEREFRDKAAGFRTLIFICVGATLFTIFSVKIAGDNDPGRVAAQIVTGVGFLGAGVILRDRGKVIGLTTASTIWLVAALGMGIGAFEYGLTFAVVGIVLIVLWIFPYFEHWLDHIREERTYEIVLARDDGKLRALAEQLKRGSLKGRGIQIAKDGERLIVSWQVQGRPDQHAAWVDQMVCDPEILELRY